MKAILVILVVAVLVGIGAIMTGFVSIDQTRTATLPSIEVKGGQAPVFDVSTAKVNVGTETRTVAVPKVEVGTKTEQVQVPAVTVSKP